MPFKMCGRPCPDGWATAPCGLVDVSVDDAWAAGNQRMGSGWSSRQPAPAAELEFEAASAMIRKESGRDHDRREEKKSDDVACLNIESLNLHSLLK